MFFGKQNRQSYSYKSANILIQIKTNRSFLNRNMAKRMINVIQEVFIQSSFAKDIHIVICLVLYFRLELKYIQLNIDGIDGFVSKNHIMKLRKMNLNTTQRGS